MENPDSVNSGKKTSHSEQSSPSKESPSNEQKSPTEQITVNEPSKQDSSSKQTPQTEESPSSTTDKSHQDSPVLILNKGSFKEYIASKDPTLVLFYTTWCGSCKRFKPKYKEVAKELKVKIPLRFAAYDCTQNEEEILDEYEIVRFPTVKLFREGKFEREYDGKLTNIDLTTFAMNWGKRIDVKE